MTRNWISDVVKTNRKSVKKVVFTKKNCKKRSDLMGFEPDLQNLKKITWWKNNFRNNWPNGLIFSDFVHLTSRTFPLNMSPIAQIFQKLIWEYSETGQSIGLTTCHVGVTGNLQQIILSKSLSEFSEILHT